MNDSLPLTGIVVVSYNTCDLLRRCLASVQLTAGATNVVVVDNASADGSAAMVTSQFPAAQLIANSSNLGFATATNQGIAVLLDNGASFIMLLNPDAELGMGALAAMVAFLQAHPRVGCVGARLSYPDGTFQEGAWRFPTPLMTLLDLFPPRGPLLGRLYRSALNGRYQEESQPAPFPIDHPLGAAMLLRREALCEVGLFDEDYWMYVEEVDWCRRAKAAGWAIWQIPQAHVMHVGGASSAQFKGRSLVALYRSRLRYIAKFDGPRALRVHRAIVHIGMLWATLKTWREWASGRLATSELRARIAAYGEITRL